ncbi:MAG TPA: TonB-dependent receptor, partial [Pseudomonadales bacterium]|nr:TonB-dependent receptor [Pseudomonadales bacterium]
IQSVGSDLLYHTQTEKEAFAVYTQAVWDINELFTLTAGVRYAEDEITAEENLFRYTEVAGAYFSSGALGLDLATYNLLNGGLVPDASHVGGFAPTPLAVNGGIPVAVSVYRPFERKDDEITWRVNLDWKVSDATLIYFSATTGTRAGGYSLVYFSQTPSYEPEELLAYEVGYKSQFFDDTFQIFASAYFYDYESIHTFATEVAPPLTDFGGTAGTSTTVLAAPGAEIWGLEAEAMWLVTDNVTLGANFSYTPSEYTEDLWMKDSARIQNPGSLFPDFTGQVLNIKGNDLLQVPELKYTGWASYSMNLSDGSNLEFFGVYSWIDDVYYSPFMTKAEMADSYDRVDLRATWISATGNWIVSGFVNNIFDDIGVLQVLRHGQSEMFRHSAGTTAPRMYGVELTYALRN